MKEKIKTLILTSLVAASLWQTYMLSYSKPEFERVEQLQYIDTELTGSSLDVYDLIYPYQIVLHFGEDRHTVLYPEQEFYKKIYEEKIRQRAFDGFRKVNDFDKDWEQLRKDRTGFEIFFRESIPVDILQSLMQLRGDILFSLDQINRMWVMTDEKKEEVIAYFFSADGTTVYESTKADLLVNDVEQYVAFGEFLNSQNNYFLYDNSYLPSQPVQEVKIQMEMDPYTAEQLKNSLFVDPSISRNFSEKDGTEIYTDGKRGLQISKQQQWMSYSDPVAPLQSELSDAESNLFTAVQFINKHGGWNGSYMLQELPKQWDQTYRFVKYFNSLPVISRASFPFGNIEITLQENSVTSYERSMIQMSRELGREGYLLPGGDQLLALIEQYKQANGAVTEIFPAYEPEMAGGHLQLIPRWAVKRADGAYDFLPQVHVNSSVPEENPEL